MERHGKTWKDMERLGDGFVMASLWFVQIQLGVYERHYERHYDRGDKL